MSEGSQEVSRWETTMKKNKVCPVCGKKLLIGEKAVAVKRLDTKYYPVKGLMGFVVYKFYHLGCIN